MTTFLEIQTELIANLGGRDDTDAIAAIKRGINAGIFAAAFTFEPPELRTTGNLIATNGGGSVLITSLTRPLRIESVYNTTGSAPVYSLPYKMLEILWLPTSGNVQFYSMFGNSMYYKPDPTGNETLLTSYLQYPARLDDDSDLYPFNTAEDYVLVLATAYAFAFLEEGETSAMWAKLGETYGLPEAMVTKIRRVMRGEVIEIVGNI